MRFENQLPSSPWSTAGAMRVAERAPTPRSVWSRFSGLILEGLADVGTMYPCSYDIGYAAGLDIRAPAREVEATCYAGLYVSDRPPTVLRREEQPQRRRIPKQDSPVTVARVASETVAPATPSPAAGWRKGLVSLLAGVWTSMRREQERRRAIRELQMLDDRGLRDIGLSRADIEFATRFGDR